MALWILGLVFALVGLPSVLLALRAFGKDRAISRWPRAHGMIISSSVQSEQYSARDDNGFYRTYTSFGPEVRFRYAIAGIEYEGTKIARQVVMTTNLRAVQARVDRYAPGTEVMVYYDPADPNRAYLEIQRSLGGVILILFGGLFMAIGFLMIVIDILT